MRIEAPPSVPCATGTIPDAMAAQEAPEDPPAERLLSNELRAAPKAVDCV